MKKHIYFSYVAIMIVLLYSLYNAYFRYLPDKTNITSSKRDTIPLHREDSLHKDMGNKTDTPESIERYITHVIVYGSDRLRFKPHEVMDPGFASKEDAPKIACYVLVLSGNKTPESCPKDAPMYYSSNCAGCHGDDGKGLNGTYPDLTRRPLLGLQKE